MHAQPAILAPVPPFSRSTTYTLRPGIDPEAVRDALGALTVGEGVLVGVGAPLAALLGLRIDGLRPFPALAGPGVAVPSTQGALWVRVAGADPGEALLGAERVAALLAPVLEPREVVDGSCHRGGRDLTGYVDGTENPTGEAAERAAIREDGWSFVAVQRWDHDLRRFGALSPAERDAAIGRTREDDRELPDAPPSAHVRRTAQESFEPAAFLVRRSTPFLDRDRHGLLFVAFGRSLDAFEAQLRRMVGLDDGVVDALFRFSTPVTGGAYACPPTASGRLVP